MKNEVPATVDILYQDGLVESFDIDPQRYVDIRTMVHDAWNESQTTGVFPVPPLTYFQSVEEAALAMFLLAGLLGTVDVREMKRAAVQ